MRKNKVLPFSAKAASAALALAALSASPGWASNTVPPVAGEEAAFDSIQWNFHFRQPQTPVLIKDFIDEFPASYRITRVEMLLADWFFLSHEYPLALQYYSRIPDDAFSGDERETQLYRKAFSMVKCGFYNEAAPYFRRLSASPAFGGDARFFLAYIDYVEGRYDEAYRQFKAFSAGPYALEAEYYTNQIDFRNGDYKKVAAASRRLLKENTAGPLRAETMRVGAISDFKLGNREQARQALAEYVSLAGDGAEISALYALGTIYFDEGNYDKALPLLTVVTEYPGALAQSAWLYIGQIYTARGDAQAAALAFDKAAKETWDNDVAQTAAYNLAVASTAGMALPFSDASAAMERFIDSYPYSPYASSLSSYLANAYYGRHDYQNALRLIDKVPSKSRDAGETRSKILYQLGVSRLRAGDVAGAAKYLSEASGSPDPEVAAQASLWLGDAYYLRKDYAKAIAAYRTAADSDRLGANRGLALYNLGYAYMKTRNYPKAEAAFNSAAASGSLDARQLSDARLRYADCLYYTGKYSEAMAIFRDVNLGGGQDGAYARIREADILEREGKTADQISILEGVAANPDAGIWLPEALSRLAQAYSEKGDDRMAAQIYGRLLDSEGGTAGSSQLYYSLATNAENLYNAGNREDAYKAYKRLEGSGIAALYPEAVIGVMRTAADAAETAEYSAKAAALPGVSADVMSEAAFRGAEAALHQGGSLKPGALASLDRLARSADRYWGARAAVLLGETALNDGDTDRAEETLLFLIDNGSDDVYWLARGYIGLADVYTAQNKDYLARLYLENLNSNYPGQEKDIRTMINSRLKNLDK